MTALIQTSVFQHLVYQQDRDRSHGTEWPTEKANMNSQKWMNKMREESSELH